MASSPLLAKPAGDLPAGILAVPLSVGQTTSSVRLCIILCTPPPAGAPNALVVLREGLEGTEYLGCITDAAGRALEWTVITVQKPDCVLAEWRFGTTALTNRDLDERWQDHSCQARSRYGRRVIVTAWDESPPAPLLIDVASATPCHPTEKKSGRQWILCRDDACLRDAGLPAYSASLARYLYIPELGADTPFVATTDESPANSRTLAPDDVFGTTDERIRLNPWAGFIRVRRFAPVSLNEFVDVLSGVPWSDTCRFPATLRTALPDCILMDAASRSFDRGRLFLAHHAPGVRCLEALYLRVLIFQSALIAVRDAVADLQRPLLNLTDESFDVVFGTDFSEIPFLWTAKAQLTDAGTAMEVNLGEGDVSFANLSLRPAAPYTPVAAKTPFSGHGTVRVRRVEMKGAQAVIEGTLATGTAAQDISRNDVIRLRLTVEGHSLDLSARIDEQAALAVNEYRFRTVPLALSPTVEDVIERIEGVRLPQVPFQVIPRLSTPCDLYSLGVLACRVILQPPGQRLAEILDEVQGLSHQVGLEDGNEPVAEKVARIMERDPRWHDILGAQLLTGGNADEEASGESVVPDEIWQEVLGLITRLFPEMGSHSICPSFGDMPSGGLQSVFDRAIVGFSGLGSRLRSMLLNDFAYNKEVRGIIADLLAQVKRNSASSP